MDNYNMEWLSTQSLLLFYAQLQSIYKGYRGGVKGEKYQGKEHGEEASEREAGSVSSQFRNLRP